MEYKDMCICLCELFDIFLEIILWIKYYRFLAPGAEKIKRKPLKGSDIGNVLSDLNFLRLLHSHNRIEERAVDV
jgi:hypothetical protein